MLVPICNSHLSPVFLGCNRCYLWDTLFPKFPSQLKFIIFPKYSNHIFSQTNPLLHSCITANGGGEENNIPWRYLQFILLFYFKNYNSLQFVRQVLIYSLGWWCLETTQDPLPRKTTQEHSLACDVHGNSPPHTNRKYGSLHYSDCSKSGFSDVALFWDFQNHFPSTFQIAVILHCTSITKLGGSKLNTPSLHPKLHFFLAPFFSD